MNQQGAPCAPCAAGSLPLWLSWEDFAGCEGVRPPSLTPPETPCLRWASSFTSPSRCGDLGLPGVPCRMGASPHGARAGFPELLQEEVEGEGEEGALPVLSCPPKPTGRTDRALRAGREGPLGSRGPSWWPARGSWVGVHCDPQTLLALSAVGLGGGTRLFRGVQPGGARLGPLSPLEGTVYPAAASLTHWLGPAVCVWGAPFWVGGWEPAGDAHARQRLCHEAWVRPSAKLGSPPTRPWNWEMNRFPARGPLCPGSPPGAAVLEPPWAPLASRPLLAPPDAGWRFRTTWGRDSQGSSGVTQASGPAAKPLAQR